MAKYKLTFDKETCIGTFACNSVAEKFFSIGNDGKARLNNSFFNKETEKYELAINEKDSGVAKEAESLCPVLAIKVKKMGE